MLARKINGLGDTILILNQCYHHSVERVYFYSPHQVVWANDLHQKYFKNPPKLEILCVNEDDEYYDRLLDTEEYYKPTYHRFDFPHFWETNYPKREKTNKITFSLKLVPKSGVPRVQYNNYLPITKMKYYHEEECREIELVTREFFPRAEIEFIESWDISNKIEYRSKKTHFSKDQYWRKIQQSDLVINTEGGIGWHCFHQKVPCIYFLKGDVNTIRTEGYAENVWRVRDHLELETLLESNANLFERLVCP